MIRDLGDPGIGRVIDRHRRYWDNEEAAGQKRPLYRFNQARPMVLTIRMDRKSAEGREPISSARSIPRYR